jgi:hypothetical protein
MGTEGTPVGGELNPGSASKEPFQYKSISYMSLIPILTQGIKEQQKIITDLEAKLQKMETRLSALEK